LEEDLSCRPSKKKHFTYRVTKMFKDLSWRISTGRCSNSRSKKIRKRRDTGKGKYFIKDYDPMQAVIRSTVMDHIARIKQMAKSKASAYQTKSKRKTCIILGTAWITTDSLLVPKRLRICVLNFYSR